MTWPSSYKLRADAIIDFSSNINPLGPSPRVLRALRSHLRWISRYPEIHAQGLVRHLARFHGLPEEAIVVGNGSTALIYRLPYALNAKSALILHPTFSEYERAFGLGGCRIDMVMREEADGFRPPWQRLFEALRRGYGVVMLCNPNNPTGDVISKDELTEFVEEAARLGTVVIVDEAFMDFHEDTGGKSIMAQQHKLRADTIIDFSSNINPLGPSPRVLRALRSHLRWISRYPEIHAQGLVRHLARFHGLPEEAIVVGNGSTALIYRLPYALLVKTALVLHPTFSEYERAFGLGGCRIDMVMRDEADGFRPPWQRLFEGLRRGYGVVMLCNPNNPTGDVIEKDELAEFVEEAARLGTVVVVDEAFMDFHEDATLKHEVLRRGNLIVLRSMTKCYALAGLRLGFLVASPPLAKRVREADEPWSVSALAQIAGRESLKDRNYLRRTLELIATERQYLMERLAGHPRPDGLSLRDEFSLAENHTTRLGCPSSAAGFDPAWAADS